MRRLTYVPSQSPQPHLDRATATIVWLATISIIQSVIIILMVMA